MHSRAGLWSSAGKRRWLLSGFDRSTEADAHTAAGLVEPDDINVLAVVFVFVSDGTQRCDGGCVPQVRLVHIDYDAFMVLAVLEHCLEILRRAREQFPFH